MVELSAGWGVVQKVNVEFVGRFVIRHVVLSSSSSSAIDSYTLNSQSGFFEEPSSLPEV